MKATTTSTAASNFSVIAPTSTVTNNVDSQNVSVLTTVQFLGLIEAMPLSNVVLRDKKSDRFIVLKRVELFAAKAIPTKDELLNAWKSMYFNTWKMKFEIEKCSHESLKSGNLFRNLDRFDVAMYLAGKKSLIQPNTIWIWLRGKSDLPQSQRCVKISQQTRN